MSFMIKGASAALMLAAIATGVNASPCDNTFSTQSSGIETGKPLTLDGAISEVRRVSPEIRLAGLETRALAAEADQAGRRLNPSVILDLENFSGSGALSGYSESETTLAIEQTCRLGGKRMLAQRAARARQALASAECAVVLREAELEAALIFSELSAAVRVYELSRDAAELSLDLTDTVAKRVNAGAAAPPELARAKADSASLKAAAVEAGAQVERLQYALAALWGSATPRFAPPDMAAFSASLDRTSETVSAHPRITAAEAAVKARRAEQESARVQAIPNITVSAGLRRFESTGDNAFVAGIGLPLPIFDRNRGNTRAAAFRAEASAGNRAAIEARLLADQRAAVASVKAAETQRDILASEALPAAEEAYTAAVRGYAVGKFDLTTTLDARAVLIAARIAVIQAELALQSHELRLRSLISAAPFNGET